MDEPQVFESLTDWLSDNGYRFFTEMVTEDDVRALAGHFFARSESGAVGD